jgi:predicted ester cyclase
MGEARDVMDRLTRAATEEHSVEAVVDCYADDVVLVTPDAGEIHGRDGAGDYWRPLLEALPDASYEGHRQYEVGDTAIDEGWLTGIHTGPFRLPDGQTIEPTGRQVRLRSVDLATVGGSRIKEHHLYFDQMEFLDQLGVSPPTEQAA